MKLTPEILSELERLEAKIKEQDLVWPSSAIREVCLAAKELLAEVRENRNERAELLAIAESAKRANELPYGRWDRGVELGKLCLLLHTYFKDTHDAQA